MRPTERDLMVARAVRDELRHLVVDVGPEDDGEMYEILTRIDEHDLTALIESLPEPAELVKYGCHCDIENTVSGEPDECVFDNGDIEDCVYATQLQREDKGKLQCKYWKPVSRPEPAEHVTCAFCEGAAPRCFVICDGCIEKGRVAMQPAEHEQAAQDEHGGKGE